MKKGLLTLAAIGALSLAACSETEVVQEGVQSNAIGFTNHVAKGSRAIDNTTFSQFYVYGSYKMPSSDKNIQVFNGTEVTKAGTDWTYSPTRNWIKDAVYTFAAYSADAALPGNANYGSDAFLNLANLVIDGADGHQVDIVYAKSSSYVGKDTGNPTVALEFKHILSRLDFTFQSALPEGFTAEISNASLVSVRNTGRYNGDDLSWDMVDRTVAVNDVPAISLNITDGNLTAEKNVTTGHAYVIPFEYTVKNVGITFKIAIKDSENQTVVASRTVSAYWAPKWVQNNTYSYKVTINGTAAGLEPIEFTGSVADWVTGTPSNPEFNIDPEPLPAPEP